MTTISIDLTQVITAEDKEAAAYLKWETEAKAECRRRIFDVADQTAQMNLAGAASAGLLSTEDMATWKTGIQWVNEMRTTWPTLVDEDIYDDANWPPVPDGVQDLADRF